MGAYPKLRKDKFAPTPPVNERAISARLDWEFIAIVSRIHGIHGGIRDIRQSEISTRPDFGAERCGSTLPSSTRTARRAGHASDQARVAINWEPSGDEICSVIHEPLQAASAVLIAQEGQIVVTSPDTPVCV
ncbi:hypothetical protein GCM10027068_38460 [Prescottella soli]